MVKSAKKGSPKKALTKKHVISPSKVKLKYVPKSVDITFLDVFPEEIQTYKSIKQSSENFMQFIYEQYRKEEEYLKGNRDLVIYAHGSLEGAKIINKINILGCATFDSQDGKTNFATPENLLEKGRYDDLYLKDFKVLGDTRIERAYLMCALRKSVLNKILVILPRHVKCITNSGPSVCFTKDIYVLSNGKTMEIDTTFGGGEFEERENLLKYGKDHNIVFYDNWHYVEFYDENYGNSSVDKNGLFTIIEQLLKQALKELYGQRF